MTPAFWRRRSQSSGSRRLDMTRRDARGGWGITFQHETPPCIASVRDGPRSTHKGQPRLPEADIGVALQNHRFIMAYCLIHTEITAHTTMTFRRAFILLSLVGSLKYPER
jgi:hypothetical protein